MPRVRVLPADVEAEVEAGRTILRICLDAGIDLPHNCGGIAGCSTCHVVVREGSENLSPADDKELDRLRVSEGVTIDSRLGCQARVLGDCVVEIPPFHGVRH